MEMFSSLFSVIYKEEGINAKIILVKYVPKVLYSDFSGVCVPLM